jgi:hypothetical protein
LRYTQRQASAANAWFVWQRAHWPDRSQRFPAEKIFRSIAPESAVCRRFQERTVGNPRQSLLGEQRAK